MSTQTVKPLQKAISVFYQYNLPHPHLLEYQTEMFKNRDPRHWKTVLNKLHDGTCLLTGLQEKSSSNIKIVGHHLYSKTKYPQFDKSFFNGILIESKLHKYYHSALGKDADKITPSTFLSFINFLKNKKGYNVDSPYAEIANLGDDGVLSLTTITSGLDFVSKAVKEDCSNSHLKTLGKESIFIPFNNQRLLMAESYIKFLNYHLLKTNE